MITLDRSNPITSLKKDSFSVATESNLHNEARKLAAYAWLASETLIIHLL